MVHESSGARRDIGPAPLPTGASWVSGHLTGFLAPLLVAVLAACGPGRDGEGLPPAPESDWPQWRGPSRDGQVPEPGLPADPELGAWAPRELWRQRVGWGFSSPSVAGGRLFLLEVAGSRERLAAFDARTGARRWNLDLGRRYESSHGDGPRSTPAAAGRRVFALGGWGRLVAVDAASGELAWQADLLELSGGRKPDWAFASSPLVIPSEDGGRVYVQGEGPASLVAFDAGSGERLWQLEGVGSYASPSLHPSPGGAAWLVALRGSELTAVDPGSGAVLWSFPWEPPFGANIADPVRVPPMASEALLGFYVSSSYGLGAARVDVVPGEDGTPGWRVEERWRRPRMRNHLASSVVVDGHVYGFDEELFACQRLSDGELLWKARGFGSSGGSLVAVGNRLLVLGQEGELALVRPDPEGPRELGRARVLDGPCRTSPVVAGRWLFLRGPRELAAYDLLGFGPADGGAAAEGDRRRGGRRSTAVDAASADR